MTIYLTLTAARALFASQKCSVARQHDRRGGILVYTPDTDTVKGIYPARLRPVTFERLCADGLIEDGPGHQIFDKSGSLKSTMYDTVRREQ